MKLVSLAYMVNKFPTFSSSQSSSGFLREESLRVAKYVRVLGLQEVLKDWVRLIWQPILRLVSLTVVRTGRLNCGAKDVMDHRLQNICLFLRIRAQVRIREARRGTTNLTCLLIVSCVYVTFSSATLLKALERAEVWFKSRLRLWQSRFREVAILWHRFLSSSAWGIFQGC